ncbi:SDR family NAD(P)-dependent oxidoreductase [Leucobacter luti]|uniref:Glucose 1-dehydrogenase/3-oxoacyl-[acyl-carrier protein] reductase n=1 Tax=Leucobacter luti TaxID=340320 RepID=A0A4Q7TG58_9MICO|nr:SDR family oxidoreductase [Leucobacter luti]MBL3699675.1 SDR family oxidoreductase [Leucobacter luti]RZT59451.1 glucose 1-dehydrogenase/3-oxoacyl-[acyl-carrier protein] reductase [Leucobacter luti]
MVTRQDTTLPDLSGQRVLVTGASGGVGGGIARRFAAAGAHLALHYRGSAAPVFELVEELRDRGVTAVAVRADLALDGAAAGLVADAVEALGGLDGLVNNAGIQPLAPLTDTTRAEWDEVLGTNLGAVFELSREAAAAMRADAEAGGGSAAGAGGAGVSNRWITHIASVEASRPAPAHAHYAVAKAGLVMHARAAALELGPDGIRVNTVSPGLVDRPGLAEAWPEGVASWTAHAPLGRLATAADIGNACVLLASAGATFITGQDLAVDGGMLATPGW